MSIPVEEVKGTTEALFTWWYPPTNETHTWAVDRLYAWARENVPCINLRVSVEEMRKILKTRGLEQERYDKLTQDHVRTPSLWILMPDNEHLLVDGNHRIAKGMMKFHMRLFSAYMVTYEDALQFEVVGIPLAKAVELTDDQPGIVTR